MNRLVNPCKQRGAALAVGLVMLLIISLLTVGTIAIARFELVMASNLQSVALARSSAESSIDDHLANTPLGLGTTITDQACTLASNGTAGDCSVNYLGSGPVPAGGFSLDGKFTAHHFQFDADQSMPSRGAVTSAVQGAYLIGPGGD